MEDGYHVSLICGNFIKDRERKAADHCAPEGSVHYWIQVWIANDSRQSLVDSFHELDVRFSL
jgi:hypothetical protein